MSGLLDVGLTVSSVASFNKDVAYQFLLQLCIPYGPVALVRWLQRQQHQNRNTREGGTAEICLQNISVELVVLFLGELAVELGVLNEAINRISGEEEDAASKDAFCEFCMFLKLVSAGCKSSEDDDDGGRERGSAVVPLQDLQCILEEEWLKFCVPSNGLRLNKLLSHCRNKLMHEVSTCCVLMTSVQFSLYVKLDDLFYIF